jgi:hypothetical protein
MPIQDLCPGYFSRETQKLLALDPNTKTQTCEVCGKSVDALKKDGGWIPRNHPPRGDVSSKAERVHWANQV